VPLKLSSNDDSLLLTTAIEEYTATISRLCHGCITLKAYRKTFFYRAMHVVQSAVLVSSVGRPSVRLSVMLNC